MFQIKCTLNSIQTINHTIGFCVETGRTRIQPSRDEVETGLTGGRGSWNRWGGVEGTSPPSTEP